MSSKPQFPKQVLIIHQRHVISADCHSYAVLQITGNRRDAVTHANVATGIAYDCNVRARHYAHVGIINPYPMSDNGARRHGPKALQPREHTIREQLFSCLSLRWGFERVQMNANSLLCGVARDRLPKRF